MFRKQIHIIIIFCSEECYIRGKCLGEFPERKLAQCCAQWKSPLFSFPRQHNYITIMRFGCHNYRCTSTVPSFNVKAIRNKDSMYHVHIMGSYAGKHYNFSN